MAKRPVPKYDFKAFGAAIKAAREGRKESRKKVGDEMFISPRYLANIENKGQHPSLQIFFEPIPPATEEPKPSEPPQPTQPSTEPPTEPFFDIGYWVNFAKSYAESVGLTLDSGAAYCWRSEEHTSELQSQR